MMRIVLNSVLHNSRVLHTQSREMILVDCTMTLGLAMLITNGLVSPDVRILQTNTGLHTWHIV